MKHTIQRYTVAYALATILFLFTLMLERELWLSGLSLWLLCYMLFRRVSFKAIIILGLLTDVLSVRLVGTTVIMLSLLLIVRSRKWFRNPVVVWFESLVCTVLLLGLERRGVNAPLGFWFSSVIFFLLFVFPIPFSRLLPLVRDKRIYE